VLPAKCADNFPTCRLCRSFVASSSSHNSICRVHGSARLGLFDTDECESFALIPGKQRELDKIYDALSHNEWVDEIEGDWQERLLEWDGKLPEPMPPPPICICGANDYYGPYRHPKGVVMICRKCGFSRIFAEGRWSDVRIGKRVHSRRKRGSK